MKSKIDIKDLSDLDISSLPNGFTVIFDGDKPIGAITRFDYYQYVSNLISKVKKYVQKGQGNK